MRLTLSIVLSIAIVTCLKVEAEASYDRHEWLPRWSDTDKDCQNTRHELLIQFSLAPVSFTNEKRCTVKTGLWLGPYTGQFYDLASDLDVEHIVPLSWAHAHGGSTWGQALKRQFSEDPENLWIVDDGRNQSKGDKGPDKWMPPYKPVQAIYVQRFMAIVEKYGLVLSEKEASEYAALTH